VGAFFTKFMPVHSNRAKEWRNMKVKEKEREEKGKKANN
jgi:hypothetical protein